MSTNSCKPSLRRSSRLQAELRAQVDNSPNVLHAYRPKCTTCIFKFVWISVSLRQKLVANATEWTFFDFLSKIGQPSEIQRFVAHLEQ